MPWQLFCTRDPFLQRQDLTYSALAGDSSSRSSGSCKAGSISTLSSSAAAGVATTGTAELTCAAAAMETAVFAAVRAGGGGAGEGAPARPATPCRYGSSRRSWQAAD